LNAEPLVLHEDRFFDPDPGVRRIARELFEEMRTLPIISPHGHVDARILAEDLPFPEPADLIVTPDHYILRMLYAHGVPLERLGVPGRDGTRNAAEPREIWTLFAERFHIFRGTPTGVWIDHTLHEVFGVREQLEARSATRLYDQIAEKLQSPEYRPRALYERFGIEVLATTDAATDSLEHHRAIRDSAWTGRVIPTLRPDALFQIAQPGWQRERAALEALDGGAIGDYPSFLRAIEGRREYFRSMGATATDHGAEEPYADRLLPEQVASLFELALEGRATAADQRLFQAHMLLEMAAMAAQDGLVMQLHAGSLRDHNDPLFARFGPNIGADIPLATEFTRNLRVLLNAHGNDSRFRLILFTLDESTYSRELAPLAGHYPAVRLGPAWWFHDSVEGMKRYRERTTESAGIYKTVGFNDDTRAFCSIPARHDLARRIDANWLAGLVARHVVDLSAARAMGRALTYELAREGYRLDRSGPGGDASTSGAATGAAPVGN
jgi:glucuronate isomerase